MLAMQWSFAPRARLASGTGVFTDGSRMRPEANGAAQPAENKAEDASLECASASRPIVVGRDSTSNAMPSPPAAGRFEAWHMIAVTLLTAAFVVITATQVTHLTPLALTRAGDTLTRTEHCIRRTSTICLRGPIAPGHSEHSKPW